MAKRHRDALAITSGACNPSAICCSLVAAFAEMRENEKAGTKQLCDDPAVRLMVHQLAYICNVSELDAGLLSYSEALDNCTRLRDVS